MKKGYFISLEGPDGAGKTTQGLRLATTARALGIETILTREPGGTRLGDAVREILLEPAFREMVPLTEVFLYAAARAQLYHEVIAPGLAAGNFLLCDRFIDSTLAYQVYGGRMDFSFVLQANLRAIYGRLPDKTFVLDLDPASGLARRGAGAADRVEQKPLSFHSRVREGFLLLARQFPERIVVLDGSLPPDELAAIIWSNVGPELEKLR
ncbi:MAG: dTMP kinase [Dethiobacter sp.]|nr:dTMP kinase [Dethiobacter sp.]MBS3899049.1 dTMP kinase [Dethiobacter sp.]MBS3982602.1 dTMP kinase [Dethiobacter sp.]MCL4463928.1 dTMP kinase [Bacillota bacterium]MCL5993255.1 dTMP kinase [Bacillota bacterium]